jgi:hypothetical protein
MEFEDLDGGRQDKKPNSEAMAPKWFFLCCEASL